MGFVNINCKQNERDMAMSNITIEKIKKTYMDSINANSDDLGELVVTLYEDRPNVYEFTEGKKYTFIPYMALGDYIKRVGNFIEAGPYKFRILGRESVCYSYYCEFVS